jgi:hypothetical protein
VVGFGVAVFFFGGFVAVGTAGTCVLVGATVAATVAVAVGVADAGGGGGVTGVGINVGGGGGGVPADANVCTGLCTMPPTAIKPIVSGTASPSVSRLFMQDSLRFWMCVRVARARRSYDRGSFYRCAFSINSRRNIAAQNCFNRASHRSRYPGKPFPSRLVSSPLSLRSARCL